MKKSTGELLEILKKSADASTFMKDASDDLMQQISLAEYLCHLIDSKGLNKSEVIHRSGLDRGYGYDILSGKKTPARDKVLALCFAFPLSAEETQSLLKSTGYPPLYVRLERDGVILYALEHCLSLNDTNELLYEMNYAILE